MLNAAKCRLTIRVGVHFQSSVLLLVRKKHILPRIAQSFCRMSSNIRSRSDLEELVKDRVGGISSKENCGLNAGKTNGDGVPLTSLVEDKAVDLDKLTADEKHIYGLHKEACRAGQSSYIDPSTGYIVLTQFEHINRGKCCGNCCRHCPYGHVNVQEEYRTKKFNSAFFV